MQVSPTKTPKMKINSISIKLFFGLMLPFLGWSQVEEKDNLGILANAIFPAEAKKMKPKVDTSKVTQEAVDQMKQMTNPNVKATQVATAPKAVIS